MKRSVIKSRSVPLSRGGRIRSVNPERRAKRAKKFAAYLSSSAWKKLRKLRFEADGFRCTAIVPFVSTAALNAIYMDRCMWSDWTRTGKGLVCDHLTYARFGHENLDDLRTLCRFCNARETVANRANWMR
jgi:hypothetical protein